MQAIKFNAVSGDGRMVLGWGKEMFATDKNRPLN